MTSVKVGDRVELTTWPIRNYRGHIAVPVGTMGKVITSPDEGWCRVTFDNGQDWMHVESHLRILTVVDQLGALARVR